MPVGDGQLSIRSEGQPAHGLFNEWSPRSAWS